jgi:hypothetical protein
LATFGIFTDIRVILSNKFAALNIFAGLFVFLSLLSIDKRAVKMDIFLFESVLFLLIQIDLI